jgi:hypothetical protein
MARKAHLTVVETEDRLAEAGRPEVTPEMTAAGFRAAFRMFEVWGADNASAMAMLGFPPRSTFFKWKQGQIGQVTHDTVARLSYLAGIYKALQILYRDPADADAWVKRQSLAFGGKSALERMAAGDIADLAAVRARLDAARGGWA